MRGGRRRPARRQGVEDGVAEAGHGKDGRGEQAVGAAQFAVDAGAVAAAEVADEPVAVAQLQLGAAVNGEQARQQAVVEVPRALGDVEGQIQVRAVRVPTSPSSPRPTTPESQATCVRLVKEATAMRRLYLDGLYRTHLAQTLPKAA